MLDFDKLAEYRDYLVTITNSKTGEVITGLIDNDGLTYSTGAALGESAAANGIKGAGLGLVQGAANSLGAGGIVSAIRGASYSNVSTTIKAYEGSDETPFNISMHVFATDETYNDILNKVLKFTQPNINGAGLMMSYLYDESDVAGIATNYDIFKEQLIRVTIGEYFFAAGLFCTGINHRFSQYVDEEGKPLYLQLDFSFVSYRMLNAEELAGWIRK